ncbi:MAG: hypothetical protein ACLUSL_05680 [Ruminococcus sp.]
MGLAFPAGADGSAAAGAGLALALQILVQRVSGFCRLRRCDVPCAGELLRSGRAAEAPAGLCRRPGAAGSGFAGAGAGSAAGEAGRVWGAAAREAGAGLGLGAGCGVRGAAGCGSGAAGRCAVSRRIWFNSASRFISF